MHTTPCHAQGADKQHQFHPQGAVSSLANASLPLNTNDLAGSKQAWLKLKGGGKRSRRRELLWTQCNSRQLTRGWEW
jgi:hypothetical protein